MKRVFIGRVEIRPFGDIPGFLFLSHKAPLCSIVSEFLTGYANPKGRCRVTFSRSSAVSFEGEISSCLKLDPKEEQYSMPVQKLEVGTHDLFKLLASNEGKSCRLEFEVKSPALGSF